MKSRRATIGLCRLLAESNGGVLSGGEASRVLSLSRQGIWKTIKDLEEEGFGIATIPKKGYVLKKCPSYDLAPSLAGSFISPSCPWGEEIYVYDSLSSTQETAKNTGRQSGTDGLVVIAEEQTAGRGRRDRTWVSPKGSGLFFSVYFRPKLPPGRLQMVNLAAGLSVKEAVRALYGLDLSLKWPNDLLAGGKKVCGILSEASSDSERIRDCCTGMGINVSPPDAVNASEKGLENAASLSDFGCAVHRGRLAAAIIENLYRRVEELGTDGGISLLAEYRDSCSTIGRTVLVLTEEETVAGIAEGIGDNGELLVCRGGRTRSFCAADVVHATPEEDKA